MTQTTQLTVLQRVENLEKSQKITAETVDSIFNQFRDSLTSSMEVVEALVGVLTENDAGFMEKIQAKMKQRSEARAQERVAQEKKQLEHLVASGVLVPADKITERSILVGRIFDANGEVLSPGRHQLEYGQLNPGVKELFLGQSVGFLYESDQKDKLEVLEIYEFVPQNKEASTPAP